MLETARRYFEEDIQRAEALLALANQDGGVLEEKTRSDLRSAAVAMAVGAMDAYFCDAYVDCLTKCLQNAKAGRRQMPRAYKNRTLPVDFLLSLSSHSSENWALRMAARNLMEKESVLSVEGVKDLFNPVLPDGSKLWPAVMDPLMQKGWKRFTGKTKAEYVGMASSEREKLWTGATEKVKARIQQTIQLRHDWVHNCGRPKSKIKALGPQQARARIREVRAVVDAVDCHLGKYREV